MRFEGRSRAAAVLVLLLAVTACSGDDGAAGSSPTTTVGDGGASERTTTTADVLAGLEGACTDEAGDVESGGGAEDAGREGVDLLDAAVAVTGEGIEVTATRAAGLDVNGADVLQLSVVLLEDAEHARSVAFVHGAEGLTVHDLPGAVPVRRVGLDEAVELEGEELQVLAPPGTFGELDDPVGGRVVLELARTEDGRFLGDTCTLDLANP